MHNRLEQYLSEVAARLGPLPTARRNDEIKEIRQHLLNAVIVNREMGLTEDEAAANALEQFGSQEELGGNIVWAWRREEQKRNKRASWKMAGVWGAFCVFEGLKSPHEIGRLVVMFVAFTIMLGWRHLPARFVPAWWAFDRHPLPVTRRWIKVCAAVVCLSPLYIPHLLWMHVSTQALAFLMFLTVFCVRHREQKKTEPT